MACSADGRNVTPADDLAGDSSWGRVFILLFAGVALAFQIGKVPPALAALTREFDLDLVASGLIVSVFTLIAGGAGIAFGVLADRMGHARMVTAGLAASALGSLGGSFALGAAPLVASRVVEGLGFVMTVVAVPSLIVAVTRPRDRRKALGLWGAFMPTGTSLMMLVSGPILAAFGWRGLWQINAAILLLWALLIWRLHVGTGRTAAAGLVPMRQGLRAALRPAPLLLFACFASYSALFLAVAAFLPLLLVQENGLSPGLAGVLASAVVAVNIIGNVSAGWVAERGIGPAQAIIGASLVAAVATTGLFVDLLPLPLRYGMALLYSAVGGLIPGTLFGIAPAYAPGPAFVSSVVGLVAQGGSLGQLIGPIGIAATVSALGGWSAAPAFTLALAATTIACALALGRRDARTEGAAGPGRQASR